MFKVSQEIYINASDSINHSNTYGRYQRLDEDGAHCGNGRAIFVAPELSEVRKVQVLHFPTTAVAANVDFDFVIVKNGAHGNIAVRHITPSLVRCDVPLALLTNDSYTVRVHPTECGQHKIHVRLNDVELPVSPLTFEVTVPEADGGSRDSSCSNDNVSSSLEKPSEIPVFKSDASRVETLGLGLHQVSVVEPNEFTVDASAAGNNILYVAICGPDGCQCDEVAVRHVGNHVYTIAYCVRQRGAYVVVVKWGDKHIPKSPFQLHAR